MKWEKMTINRRDVLKGGAMVSAGLAVMPFSVKAAAELFRHGVASGDPLADRVILWTRLTLPLPTESMDIEWQVAADKSFQKIIRSDRCQTDHAHDGIVKIDCDGLKAGSVYFYRFMANGQISPIGRTKTLPQGRVERLKLGIASCANYNAGFFTAYRGLAAQDDLDAVIHLGDYIYEYGNHVYGDNKLRSLQPRHEVLTLADYRARYAHYRSDPDLQKLHAHHAMIAVWDDHEVANNGWRDGAQNHDPQKEGAFSVRQQAARQAYFEWLPIRPRSNHRIYRRFAFGDLAHLIMIDTRHEGRDAELTFAGFLKKNKDGKSYFDKPAYLKALQNPRRHIMSRPQELWVKRVLNQAARQARWSVIGNQIPFEPTFLPMFDSATAPKNIKPAVQLLALAKKEGLEKLPLSLDEWSGFPVAQARMVRHIRAAGNPTLVLTGDTHHGWAAHYGDGLGLEIATPGVSSPGAEAYVPKDFLPKLHEAFLKNNPSMIFRDVEHRGFMVLELTREHAQIDWVWADVKTRRGRLSKGPRLLVARRRLGEPRLL